MSFVRLTPLHDIPDWSQTAVPPRNTRGHCAGRGVLWHCLLGAAWGATPAPQMTPVQGSSSW